MKIFFGRSYLTLIVLSAFMKTIQSYDESNNTDVRKARVNGRIVKLYSGAKPDPVLCLDEGFKADPVDCTVFYRCTKASKGKYTLFRFQCGPGTVYDPETEVCNHPSLTKRSECGHIMQPFVQENENNIETHELPSPINTGLPVYTVHTGSRNVTTLTPTLTTQIIERYPFYKPTATVAYPQITVTEQEYLENSNIILNYPLLDSKNKTQDTATPFTNIASNTEKSFSCTSDGFIGDTENCRKFYRCVNNARGGFVRYEFLCSESTVWDDNMQSCNHPWAVQNRRCGRSDFYNKNKTNNFHETSLKNNQTQNNFEVENTEQQNYNENVVLDKNTLPYGHKLPDKKLNSSKQKDYTELESVYQELPAGLSQYEINKNEQQNDYNNELSNYYTTVSSSSSNIFQQNFSTENIIAVKSTQCTQSGFMADPSDCKRFYRCVDNGKGSFMKYEFSCSQETVWDRTLEACNHAWAVKECGVMSLHENVHETTQVFNKNPTSTSASTVVQESGSDYMNQVSKEHESSSTTLTTISLLSTTETTKSTSTECSSSGFFGDLNDCQKFYRCVDNEKGTFIKYDYKCGDGTLWDQSIEACNHDWAVKTCGLNTMINTTQTSNQEQDKSTTNTYIQTTTIKNIQNNENNSGYNHPQSYLTTTTPLMDVSKTTSKYPLIQNSVCRSSGFMGDTYDCTKFYRCVDNGNGGFTRHEFSCGEGTVWDSEIEACNHAFAVKQCGASIEIKEEATSIVTDDEQSNGYGTSFYNTHTTASKPTTIFETTTKATINNDTSECKINGFMGDKLNCKKFYRCVEDGRGGFIRYEFSCGEGTVWDPKIQACNHEWAAEECNIDNMQTTHNNNDVSMKPTENSGNTHPEYEHTTPNTKPDNITAITTVSSSISTTSAASSKHECISNGFMGDQNDCRKFYRCVDNGNGGFTQYEFICGQGTAWDPNIESCNHESVVNCAIHSVTQFETTASTQNQDSIQVTMSSSGHPVIQTQQISTPVYTSSIASVINENISNHEGKNCTSEGFFASLDDCKKFFRCVNDGKGGYTKYEFSCGEGTIWVQEIQSCDHDSDVISCNYTQDIATTAKYETTIATDNSIISNTSGTDRNNKPNNKECLSEGFYPNLNDCRKFYRCVDNGDGSYSKHEFSCAEGTAWDVNIGSCNFISEVKGCQIDDSINDNNKPNKPLTEDEENLETEKETTTIKTTTLVSTAETTKPISQNICKKDGYYGNTEDCTKFYRCVISEKGDYDKYDYSCGEGTIWDQDIIACNHPRDVINSSCKSENVSPPTTISMSTQYTSDDNTNSLTTLNPLSTSSASTSNKNETNSTCSNNDSSTESSSNKNITCKKAGFYADPADCKKFYRCVDWDNNGENFSIYHFECGDGTIWDPALDTCNYIDAINPPRNCNGTVQTENITELSSTTEQISTTTTQDQISSKEPVSTTKQMTTQSTTTQTTTTTTQRSTTQPSTTQSSTSQEPTTQQSTVESSTTPQSSTLPPTTQQSTVESSTTPQSSTLPPTTQQSTTQPSTTQQTMTQSSTTQESTTQSPTTQQSTTTEKSTTQQETTIDSGQTTTQTSQVQTTISTTEQTSPEYTTTTVAEPNITITTTESSDQTTSTTNQDMTSTQQLTTEQNTQTVIQSSTTDASTTGSELESSNSNQTCLDTDEDQFLLVCPTSFKRHPKYCNLFYQCVEDKDSHEMKIAVFNCPNNTIYDESKVQCVEADKSVKKCSGQIAQKRRIKRLGFANNEPVMVTKDSMACPSLGHFPFEKYEECSAALLKCELTKYGTLRGYVYKCPQGFVYWSISRRCEPIKKLKDCRKPSDEWERRYDIPIEKYNVAQ